MNHFALKVAQDSDLDVIAKRIGERSVTVEALPVGALPMCGRSLMFNLPSGHEVRVFAEKEIVGTAVGNTNPDPWPDDLRGAGVHWLDHLALVCPFNPEQGINKVAENAEFLQEVLDFKLNERAMVGPEGSVMAVAFLSRTNTPHDIAFVPGPTLGLHHIAFYLEDWNAVLRSADVFAKARKNPSLTPNRHGMTRGVTFYAADPSGNKTETFAGLGYLSQPDRPLVTWTEDQLDRGLFFLGGVDSSFVEAYT